MELKTFHGPSMSAALAEVKSTLGSSAVILHTRTYKRNRWLGLRRQEMVEITASRGVRPATETPRRQQPAPQRPVPAPAAAPAPRHVLESAAAQSAAVMGLVSEVSNMKAMVQELVTATHRQKCPQVPEELLGFYSQLIQNDVAQELAVDIIKTVHRTMRPDHFRQPEFVRNKMAEHIERLLPTSGPIVRTKTTGPHIVALIGPTGVGKTTTIAKLAATLKIREKRRVGMITIDTYRIAAVEQLRKYADILNSPLKVIGSPGDMPDAIKSMSDCDFILIDTAGRSPNDGLKLGELNTFLVAARPDEVHLVLSSTSSQACVELAVSRFSDVRVDKIIFTKLDEAAHIGVVLNVIHKLNKSVSYITTGQDVPDDIEVGQGRRLAQLLLGLK